jgi:hypothetical protein
MTQPCEFGHDPAEKRSSAGFIAAALRASRATASVHPRCSVDAPGSHVDLDDRGNQRRVSHRSSRRRSGPPLVEAGAGDTKNPARHRDGDAVGGELTDQPEPHLGRRSPGEVVDVLDRATRTPNDHWIRNINPRLRTLPVAADAPVTVNALSADETGDSQTNSTSPCRSWRHTGTSGALFWLTTRDGAVTAIAQQWTP